MSVYALYDPVNEYIGYIGIAMNPDFRFLQHLKDYKMSDVWGNKYIGQCCIVNDRQTWFNYLKSKEIMVEMIILPPADFDGDSLRWGHGIYYSIEPRFERHQDDKFSEQYYIEMACQDGHQLANGTYYKRFDVPIRCKYQDCLMCNPVGKDSVARAKRELQK